MNYTPTDQDYEWAARLGRWFVRRVGLGAYEEEAAQEARIAVWRGAHRFEDRGVPFRKYIRKRVLGRIKDMIRVEIGSRRQANPLRARSTVRIADEPRPGTTEVSVIDPAYRPVLENLAIQEQVSLLYKACCAPDERLQLASWAGLITQRAIAKQARVTEAAISLRAKQLLARLRETGVSA